MKILYIQHTSVLGGSSKSLLELINNLPKNVKPHVLCPKGDFSDLLEGESIKVFNVKGIPQFDNTRIGHYRKLRWLILLREFFYLPFFFFKILQLKKENFDIVHVNEITQLFSIVFSKIFLAKTVVHVRSMQSVKKNIRYKSILRLLNKYVDSIITIDEAVKSTLNSSLRVNVIHNGMRVDNVKKNNKSTDNFTVGIVSNFQRYKGIIEFIDAANICINEKSLDINFVIFGASYQDTKTLKQYILQIFGFREDLDTLIKEKISKYKLSGKLILKGYVHSSDEIYNNIDLLTFPSHLNAVGRPVFEAAFYGVPSIVAIRNEFDDAVINNITGICIKEKDVKALADSIEKLFYNKDLLLAMGKKSSELANELYNSNKNSVLVYNIYNNLMGKDKDV